MYTPAARYLASHRERFHLSSIDFGAVSLALPLASRRMREKQARTGEDAPVESEPLLDGVSEAGREGARWCRFVISANARKLNAWRFAAFSSERVKLFAPMLPNSMIRVHSSLGS
jgi:hypothetical protein